MNSIEEEIYGNLRKAHGSARNQMTSHETNEIEPIQMKSDEIKGNRMKSKTLDFGFWITESSAKRQVNSLFKTTESNES